MSHTLKKIFSIIVLLSLVALALYYLFNNFHEFKQLSLKNIYLLLPIVIIFLINYFFTGLSTIYIMKPVNLNLKFWESFQLSIITGFYNLITPFRGGMAVRALYLKKKHNFPYVDFISTLAASYILIFLTASFIGLISTYIIYKTTNIFNWIIFLIFLISFLLMTLIIIFSPRISESQNYIINKISRIMNGWHLIKNNKKIIFSIIIFSLLQLLISSYMLYLQFKVFGIDIPFISAVFITSITSLSILISITPANLGIQEAITVFSALTLGISPAQSLSAALLGRVIQMIVLFILGPIFSYVLFRRKD